MIRVVFYLVVVGLLAFGAAWFADRPGDVVITWLGRRIETSVMVLVGAVTFIAVAAVALWSLTRAIMRAPDLLWLYLRSRNGVRGYLAISRGLIAIGSGDVHAAKKFTDEAHRIAPEEPLTLLLTAQTAQMSGDSAGAERTFHAMAAREDTKLLGLHGLFIEAQRREDVAGALLYAEEAAKSSPAPAWAGHAVLEFRCAAGDWPGALERLDRNMKSGLIDRARYRRQRGVLLAARALATAESDPASAQAQALEAVKFAPTLVPAAALAGQLLADAGDPRKASRIVEMAWRASPHPDLAEAYAHIKPGDSARERLTRVEALAQKSPGHVEGALAVARAALDAQEFAIARNALAPLLAAPTQRVAMLMAELEEREHGDEGRAREWMARALHARRDPAWIADGFVSDRWMPVSPVTGRLDAFQWKEPLGEFGGEGNGAMSPIDGARRTMIDAPREPRAHEPLPRAAEATPASIMAAAPASRPLIEDAPPLRRAREPVPSDPPVEKMIPLVHVPDDPGPDAELHIEPQTETHPPPHSDGWRKWFKP